MESGSVKVREYRLDVLDLHAVVLVLVLRLLLLRRVIRGFLADTSTAAVRCYRC